MLDASYKRALPVIVVLIVVMTIGYFALTRPDLRNTAQKVGDAIEVLPSVVDKAERQMDGRTPGEKLNDAAKDATDDIKKSLNRQ
jgi:hypothetical protein